MATFNLLDAQPIFVGQTATGSNFCSDVTADGVIKNPDVALVKSKKGTVLP